MSLSWGSARGARQMLARSECTAVADQAPQHARDFIASGSEVAQLLRGKCMFSTEQAQSRQGFGNRGAGDGVVARLGRSGGVPGTLGEVEEDAGGRASDLVPEGFVARGAGHRFAHFYGPNERLRLRLEFLRFHALSYRIPNE